MKQKAFHKLSYGLYIISTHFQGKDAGYIGNTAFQVTSAPPQIAISCHKKNASTEKILQSKSFAISVLKKETDTSLIGKFGFMSSDETDKFLHLMTKTATTGAPIVLDSTIAWFDCQVISTHDVGTHILIIGKVLNYDIISDEDPLTYDYYRAKYKMLAPKNAPTYLEKNLSEAETQNSEQLDQTQHKNEPTPAAREQTEKSTATYTCTICGFQYNPEEGDPALGIPPGTAFDDLPDDYKCPICNAGKDYFRKD